MQQRESARSVSKRSVIIIPNARVLNEFEPLLAANLPAVPATQLGSYPSPSDLTSVLGTASSRLVFLDVSSDVDQAMQLLAEMGRIGSGIQVFSLLSGNDPDLILRCLRAGAVDFLIQPFTPDQIEVALSKLSRLVPAVEGT